MSSDQDLPRLLLVSASAMTHKSLDRLLAGEFRLTQASDTSSAWDTLLAERGICAVLCELEASVDHRALLERLRTAQEKALAALPVLLLVGENVDEEQRDAAFAAGATDFIAMPFSSAELTTRVRLHARLFKQYSQQQPVDVVDDGGSFDALNNLMNEQHFTDRLDQEMSFSLRHKTYTSVCLLQLDGADELREQLGKNVFAGIIKAVAQVIDRDIRREDTFAYLGDASFALLYPVTNGLGAHQAARRLLARIENTRISLQGEEIPISVSAGLYSALPLASEPATRIMQTVRDRMRQARQKGGNQIVSSKTELEQNNITLDQALNMISHQRTDGLAKQVPYLLDTLMPLLEFARVNNEVELEGVFGSLGLD